MAQSEYKFEGWMGLDPSSSEGNMKWQEFTPKEWEETDVDIKISHCGICGSDLHTLRSGWVSSANISYPTIPFPFFSLSFAHDHIPAPYQLPLLCWS